MAIMDSQFHNKWNVPDQLINYQLIMKKICLMNLVFMMMRGS